MKDTGVPIAAPTITTGYAMVLVAALGFAGNNAFSVMSYQGGATPLTLITARMILTLGALSLLMTLARIPIGLPPRQSLAAMALGLLNGTMAFCLLSAFDHIPVGLAILVFYLYPVLTGVGAWITGQERASPGLFLGLIGGFAGLVLALETDGDPANATGLALALAAAILMAAVALVGAGLLRQASPRALTLHMHISAVGLFVILSLISGTLSLPETERGWVGFLGVPVFYTLSIVLFSRAWPG